MIEMIENIAKPDVPEEKNPEQSKHYTGMYGIDFANNEITEFFEKMESKDRIFLDGTIVKINVCKNGNGKTIWAHSAREKSHPEINNLLTSTLEIFRRKNLLSSEKMITDGY